MLGTLLVVRIAVITDHWRETNRHYRRFVQTLDQLPEGARLLSAIKLASYDAASLVESRIPEPMPMANLSCWGSSGDQFSSRISLPHRANSPCNSLRRFVLC